MWESSECTHLPLIYLERWGNSQQNCIKMDATFKLAGGNWISPGSCFEFVAGYLRLHWLDWLIYLRFRSVLLFCIRLVQTPNIKIWPCIHKIWGTTWNSGGVFAQIPMCNCIRCKYVVYAIRSYSPLRIYVENRQVIERSVSFFDNSDFFMIDPLR